MYMNIYVLYESMLKLFFIIIIIYYFYASSWINYNEIVSSEIL